MKKKIADEQSKVDSILTGMPPMVAAHLFFDFGDATVYSEKVGQMLGKAQTHVSSMNTAHQKEDWTSVDEIARQLRDVFRTLVTAIEVDEIAAFSYKLMASHGQRITEEQLKLIHLFEIKMTINSRAEGEKNQQYLHRLIHNIADMSDKMCDNIHNNKLATVAEYYDKLQSEWNRFVAIEGVSQLVHDIDIETPDKAEADLKQFLEKYPEAQKVPLKNKTATLIDNNISTQVQISRKKHEPLQVGIDFTVAESLLDARIDWETCARIQNLMHGKVRLGEQPGTVSSVLAKCSDIDGLGRVMKDGKAVSDARRSVSIFLEQLQAMLSSPWPNMSVHADKNGNYSIAGLPAGETSINATLQPNLIATQKKILLEQGQEVELNFGDETGFVLTGVVVMGEEPIEAATVDAIQTSGSFHKWVRTDSNGKFQLTGIPEGDYRIVTEYHTGSDPITFTRSPGDWFVNTREASVSGDLVFNVDLAGQKVGGETKN